MTSLSTRLNSVQVTDPTLRLFLQSMAKSVDRLNVNFHLDINEPFALSEPTTGANARAPVANLPSDIVIIKSLRFLADKNGLYLASSMTQCCRAWHSANQATVTAVPFVIAFDSEYFDTDDMHDLTVNNTRILFNTEGKYIVGANINWDVDNTGLREIRIKKNGTTYLAIENHTGGGAGSQIVTMASFVVGDYIEVEVLQASGAGRNVLSVAEQSPIFWAHRLS